MCTIIVPFQCREFVGTLYGPTLLFKEPLDGSLETTLKNGGYGGVFARSAKHPTKLPFHGNSQRVLWILFANGGDLDYKYRHVIKNASQYL